MGCISSKEAGGVAAQSGPAAHKNYSSLIKQQTKSNEDKDIMVRVMPMIVWSCYLFSIVLLAVGG
jgi:hypothetical protein